MSKELLGLIAEQEQAMGIIQKMQINFKNTGKARLTRGYVKARKETLEEYWKNFVETNREIIKTVNKEDMEHHSYFINDYYSTYEEFYIDLKAEMTDILEDTSQISNQMNQSQHPSKSEEIKLPKITIPQFTGNYQDWTSFHDLFISLIHNNINLGNVQKLHYLKSCLSGEPEHLLKHLPVTDSNYNLAWSMLKSRYDNKRIIVNSILSRLINQRKINTGTAKSIRELLDTTIECLNKLKAEGVNTESWDTIIIHLIVSKLDTETHKAWEEEVSDMNINELPSMSKFSKFLEKRFRVLEMIQPIQSTNQNAKTNVQSEHYHEIEITSLFVDTEIHKCAYCNQDHRIFQCREFQQLILEEKIDVVQSKRLCFNCLIPGHPARYCINKSSCHICGKRHHTLLHRGYTYSHSHEREKLKRTREIEHEKQIREAKHERQNREIKHEKQNREIKQQKQSREINQEIDNNEKYQPETKNEQVGREINNHEEKGVDELHDKTMTKYKEYYIKKIEMKHNTRIENQKQSTPNFNSGESRLQNLNSIAKSSRQSQTEENNYKTHKQKFN
ncbi:uncharacterized protein [Choristoneura fumiferana]|uniref:uncharacterized protein n=1 Tax=Choristoneura fumiferana TaxID=7141 RepID=UPI003D154979